jgi:hydrogenase nickel incorporation protein HypB
MSKINLNISAQSENDITAEKNRSFFKKNNLFVLNMISSPGSGKTSLLELMSEQLGNRLFVITGDIQTTIDADRIEAAGSKAVQIETGGSCHLTARMIEKELYGIDFSGCSILVIENIGNLVCPSTYDLGENIKIAVLSTTEGDEKPVKYPSLFTRADSVIINKTDLLPHVDFDVERVKEDCYKLKNSVKVFPLSCKTRQGFSEWMNYLNSLL